MYTRVWSEKVSRVTQPNKVFIHGTTVFTSKEVCFSIPPPICLQEFPDPTSQLRDVLLLGAWCRFTEVSASFSINSNRFLISLQDMHVINPLNFPSPLSVVGMSNQPFKNSTVYPQHWFSTDSAIQAYRKFYFCKAKIPDESNLFILIAQY